MKKIDKLIISAFFGPFFLTFLVVVFILLTQHMLKYFDDIVGKDLGTEVLVQLFFYFAIFMTPVAIPLAVLLSSLMTFGNLGEHFELTAIKSAGISLLRVLLPIFVFVLGLTVVAFYSNNNFVPKAALEAYSLLYDIKQKKPAMDLKQGTFYNGIPDFSIKVDKKYDDGKTIEDIIMYDHRKSVGNKKVILADSGLMYTFNNDRYLKLELFNGNFYFEDYSESAGSKANETMSRSRFKRSEYILDLSSFGLDRTDKSLFEGNRIMRNLRQLANDVDSVEKNIDELMANFRAEPAYYFYYHLKNDTIPLADYVKTVVEKERQNVADHTAAGAQSDTTKKTARKNKKSDNKTPKAGITKNSSSKIIRQSNKSDIRSPAKKEAPKLKKRLVNRNKKITDTLSRREIVAYIDSLKEQKTDAAKLNTVLNNVRKAKSKIQSLNTKRDNMIRDKNIFDIQYHKILANSLACIVMFLIGAPLGAIIKRGGLGIPVLISILFFILFYVLTMTGEKYAKQDIIAPVWGIWSANILLFPIGLFFLRQARNDARLFEADFYKVIYSRVKLWLKRKRFIKK